MPTLIARVISFLLSPPIVLFPVPYLLVEKATQNPIYALRWTLFSYAFLFLASALVFIGVRLGLFSNFNVSKREERPMLFWIIGVVTFFYSLSLVLLRGPKVLFILVFAVLLGLIVISMINGRIKASVHVATLSAFMLFVGFLYGGLYSLLFLLVPILAWSRIKTKEHTLLEVIIGGILGSLLALIVYLVGRYIFLIA